MCQMVPQFSPTSFSWEADGFSPDCCLHPQWRAVSQHNSWTEALLVFLCISPCSGVDIYSIYYWVMHFKESESFFCLTIFCSATLLRSSWIKFSSPEWPNARCSCSRVTENIKPLNFHLLLTNLGPGEERILSQMGTFSQEHTLRQNFSSIRQIFF